MQQPRLGHINFINCLPLDYGLTHGGFGKGMTIVSDVPAVLNGLVTTGELDVSPVSSIVYAQNAAKLMVLPNVSISAPQALKSILLVTKRPLAALDGAKIALTAKSATSHGMLKVILHHAYKVTPDYFISSQSLTEGVLSGADAALFIGDDALSAYYHRSEGYYYYDLGDEWRKLTGQAMVYALWVVNRNFAFKNPEAVQTVYERVRDGFAYGLAHLKDAVATLEGKAPITTGQICEYIGLLDYGLAAEHVKALTTYYQLAHELGLIENVPELEFAGVPL